MLGGSAASLNQALKALGQALAKAPKDAALVSGELFALVDALDANPALVRALANPNRDAASKVAVVKRIMAGHTAAAVDLAAKVVSLRWSRDSDLADALEHLALDAQMAAAEQAGQLEQVEAQLFEIDQALASHRDLRTALGDVVAAPAARTQLAARVFGQLVLPYTLALFQRVVEHPRGRGIRYSLKVLGDLVADRRRRLVAVAISAVPLADAQIKRLAGILSQEYGRDIQLNVSVDPSVIGGLRIRVGDDVVDGTVLMRFTHLRRAIAA
ncbi:MAG: F0F1 ATP synthase subunit delta [Bifidobacteriaceae bacterium]|jgi:F-type H+-transporting ATPase subunit delta|nr:F0F1 ATP synthase subunit delta [Bifidobacteriaceae bacterium]